MSSTDLKAALKANKLRSLILLNRYRNFGIDIKEFAFYAMSSLTHLRALDLNGADIEELPRSIRKLKHLRLLDLSLTRIKALPGSISDLYNLRTLNLAECSSLKGLPEGMSNMSSLRHLDIRECPLICMPRWFGRLNSLQTMTMFVVGKEHGRTISELEHLNLIGGNLEIRELRNVQDPMEATKANLESKTNLRSLSLMWNNDSHMQSTASPIAEVENVFEKLQPPSNLKELYLSDYPGVNFPTWMTKMELASSPIRNLVTITLGGLERCERLPALGHLPFLQALEIGGANAVKRIGIEFYGDGGIFPSLRSLHMEGLLDLEEWSTEAMAVGQPVMAFPCLEDFSLSGCPKLRVAPRLPPSVVDVSLEGDRLLSAVSTGRLYKLRYLSIWHCESLSLLSWWDWMQDLTALATLAITDNKLMCLPDGILQLRMPSLQSLHLLCPNLKSISGEERDKQQQPPTFFMTIQKLQIDSSKELIALPEWLGSLISLRCLALYDCHRLVMLPDGLQHLTALQELFIGNCPQLKTRCERDRGEDWLKIAHIPNINFWQAKVSEEDRKENSQRSITRSIRKLRLTSCTGRG